MEENSARFHGKNWFGAQHRCQFFREQSGASVCMTRVLDPRVVLEQPAPWRRKKTHLGRELAPLLCAVIEFVGELRIEKNYQLARGSAVLRPTETKDIDAEFARDRFRCAVQRRDRVREPRTE